jgi:hypothetical protein
MDKMKIVKITQTCSECPSQWEGHTEDNKAVYVRYRWGELEVTIGDTNNIDEAISNGKRIVSLARDEDELDGHLSYDELVNWTKDVIDWPEKQQG